MGKEILSSTFQIMGRRRKEGEERKVCAGRTQIQAKIHSNGLRPVRLVHILQRRVECEICGPSFAHRLDIETS
jgi:hypothetical protein